MRSLKDSVKAALRAVGFELRRYNVQTSTDAQLVRALSHLEIDLILDVGATLRGRVVKGGQPLTNVVVGVSGVDRNSEVYVGNYTATTDTNGAFQFDHLPASKSWWLFGRMNSLKK